MIRSDFITASAEIHIYTEYSNFVFIIYLRAHRSGINREVAQKVMRWALKCLPSAIFEKYLEGTEHMWDALQTRWEVRSTSVFARMKIVITRSAPIKINDDEYDWPRWIRLAKIRKDTE